MSVNKTGICKKHGKLADKDIYYNRKTNQRICKVCSNTRACKRNIDEAIKKHGHCFNYLGSNLY